ncbi:MAG: DUF929 family protein [Acidimicrobiales bacterium]
MSPPRLGARTPVAPRAADRSAVLLASAGLPFSTETVEVAISVAKGAPIRVLSTAKIYGTAMGLQHPGLLPSKQEQEAQREIVAAAIKQIELSGGKAKGEVVATRDPAKTFFRAAIRCSVRHVVLEPTDSSRLRTLVEGNPASSLRRRLPPEVDVRVVDKQGPATTTPGRRPVKEPATSGRRPVKEPATPGRRAVKEPATSGRRSVKEPATSGRRPSGTTSSKRRFFSTPLGTAVIAVVVLGGATLMATIVHDLQPKKHAPVRTAASATVLRAVKGVGGAEENAVGLPSTVTPPAVLGGQSPLRIDGRPAAVYIGAEFCPLCAAERWAVVMALDRFGSFAGLKETTSSPWDSDPSTPTFSFYGSTYTSRYVTFLPVEREGNDTSGLGTRSDLQSTTPLESGLWSKYDGIFGAPLQFPFLDIGNRVFVVSASYNPSVLAGLDQAEVAARLDDASAPATLDIVGTANYLTAAICSVTAEQPVAVCSVNAVQKATEALKLASGSSP